MHNCKNCNQSHLWNARHNSELHLGGSSLPLFFILPLVRIPSLSASRRNAKRNHRHPEGIRQRERRRKTWCQLFNCESCWCRSGVEILYIEDAVCLRGGPFESNCIILASGYATSNFPPPIQLTACSSSTSLLIRPCSRFQVREKWSFGGGRRRRRSCYITKAKEKSS